MVRSEGLEICKKMPLSVRIDGAVLLTGGTGFVGGGILFSLLARAEELGITKIVLMVRQRSGKSLAERIKKLRDHTMFDEVRETFDKLVVGLEGDTSQRNFGWTEAQPSWPHKECLKAVLHCAGGRPLPAAHAAGCRVADLCDAPDAAARLAVEGQALPVRLHRLRACSTTAQHRSTAGEAGRAAGFRCHGALPGCNVARWLGTDSHARARFSQHLHILQGCR